MSTTNTNTPFKPCIIDGCSNNAHWKSNGALDMCSLHYIRNYTHGSPHTCLRFTKKEMLTFVKKAANSDTDECIIWPYTKCSGYGRIICKGHAYTAHRLALIFQTGQNPSKLFALHGPCNNRLCVNPKHISWGNQAKNGQDMIRDGTSLRGEKSPRAKLNTEQVLEIRHLSANGIGQRTIAKKYGVSRWTIVCILKGKSWAWLK